MMRIGCYEFEKSKKNFLGKGSFSVVYKGKYIGINNQFVKYGDNIAIKIINTEKLSERAKEILEEEVRIMDIIKNNPHPNIVECYDVIKQDDKIYIIMELCDSGDLRGILKKPIKENYTQFFFSQLANGLKYLDQNNIIHRDIKPRNILLTNNKRVLKIADFGFAKSNRSHTQQINLYSTICGSPMYMAPEIMDRSKYNNQTDLWSIGMILYEMLYGKHPYQNCKSYEEIKNKNNQFDDIILIPPPNTPNKKVSNECLTLLKNLLQKDVKKRITWTDFFNNPWLNVYKYVIPKNNKINNDYKNRICSTSIGSLSPKNIPLNIIDDYCGDSYQTPDSTYDDCMFNMEMDKINTNTGIKVEGIIDKDSVLGDSEDYCSYQIMERY